MPPATRKEGRKEGRKAEAEERGGTENKNRIKGTQGPRHTKRKLNRKAEGPRSRGRDRESARSKRLITLNLFSCLNFFL